MAKKTKRKIAHPKLPMQRQLNLPRFEDVRHSRHRHIFGQDVGLAVAAFRRFGFGSFTIALRWSGGGLRRIAAGGRRLVYGQFRLVWVGFAFD